MDQQLIFAIGGALIAIGVSWGIMEATSKAMRSDLTRLQSDIDDIKERYVTNEHFKQIVRPLRDQISEIERDIKSILTIVRRNDRP